MGAELHLLQEDRQKYPTSSPAHLFAIRARRKSGPGKIQTRVRIYPNRGHIFHKKITEYVDGVTENTSTVTAFTQGI